jgi:hypothetical protein
MEKRVWIGSMAEYIGDVGIKMSLQKSAKMFESTLREGWLYHTFHQDLWRAA